MANLGAMGWFTYAGSSTPSATCSAILNNGYIAINATPTAYQCSNATGSYAWNTLGGSSFNPASPGPIGGTTPSTGAFTNLTASGTVAAGATNSPIINNYPAAATTAKLSLAALPNLASTLANYRHDLMLPIWLTTLGSSVGCGATLPNAAVQAPGAYLAAQIAAKFDPTGNYSTFPWAPSAYNFQFGNFCSNGNFAEDAQWWGQMAGAPSAFTVYAGGTGYAVGDLVAIYQGTCNDNNPTNAPAPIATCKGEATAVVTAISSGGVVTALQPSAYPNYQLDTAPAAVTYTTGTNIPVGNGYAYRVSLAGQTGTGSGLKVNITAVGITPTVVSTVWGTNDFTPNGYNGFTGSTFITSQIALGQELKTIQGLNADPIVLTAPHPTVDGAYASNYVWSGTKSQLYPTSASVTDLTVSPPLSQATQTANFAGTGVSITADSRFLWGNAMQRTVAQLNKVPVIDVEHSYFNALSQQITASGSQAAAETVFYGSGGTVHPILAGVQAFDNPVIQEATAGLLLAEEQPTVQTPFLAQTSDQILTIQNATVVNAGASSTTVAITLPTSTVGLLSGTLNIYGMEYNFPGVTSSYTFVSCPNYVRMTGDKGTNAFETNPLYSAAISGHTLTLTVPYSTTYVQYFFSNIAAVSINDCASSGSSVIFPAFSTFPTPPASAHALSTNSTGAIISNSVTIGSVSSLSGGTTTTTCTGCYSDSGIAKIVVAGQNYQGNIAILNFSSATTTAARFCMMSASAPTNYATLAVASNPVANDTITINGAVITFVGSGASGNQVNIGGTALLTSGALYTMLAASSDANLVKSKYVSDYPTSAARFFMLPASPGFIQTYAASVPDEFTWTPPSPDPGWSLVYINTVNGFGIGTNSPLQNGTTYYMQYHCDY